MLVWFVWGWSEVFFRCIGWALTIFNDSFVLFETWSLSKGYLTPLSIVRLCYSWWHHGWMYFMSLFSWWTDIFLWEPWGFFFVFVFGSFCCKRYIRGGVYMLLKGTENLFWIVDHPSLCQECFIAELVILFIR